MSNPAIHSSHSHKGFSSSPGGSGPALRVALVGAGKMAQHHARSIAASAVPARVVAFADPSDQTRETMLGVVPGAKPYPSLEALLEAEPIDVVHVCTPPATHERMAELAIEHGCHVYVEKPFASSVATAERLLALAADRGVGVCSGHQLLFEAPARRALDLISALGGLVHVESYFSFRTVRRSPDGRTPLRADLQLLDILPHPVYLLLHFLEQAVPNGRSEIRSIEVGPAGTVHALIQRGPVTGTLVVTLEGRPVESYLRAVGTNGSLHADFVRGTVQRLIGPGTSGIDKLLNPYRLTRQLFVGTTAALSRRFLSRRRSYPGLVEILEAFHSSIRAGMPSPVSAENILETVHVWEQVAAAIALPTVAGAPESPGGTGEAPRVAVTGGTGFLGQEVVRHFTAAGTPVLVLSRREPPEWERISGAVYGAVDLSRPLPSDLLSGVDVVIHCAAATSGGWEEHQAHSIDATEHVLRAAHAAGVYRLVHISSTAVLQADSSNRVRDDSPLHGDSRSQGPYVWGKLESERLARRLGSELGLQVRIVRPGAIVDDRAFDPPGKLGRRLGNLFVAVGSPRDVLGVVDVRFAARAIAWIANRFDEVPTVMNLVAPDQPLKRDMLRQLRRSNPDLRVVWMPRLVLHPLSLVALGAQKLLRPGKTPIDVAAVFRKQAFDSSTISGIARKIDGEGGEAHSPAQTNASSMT